jgi:hypothetical protein
MAEVGCLKDGCFQNLQVKGQFTNPHVEKTRAVAVGTAAVTAVNGDVLIISVVNPGDITLPTARAGSKIRMLWASRNSAGNPFTVTTTETYDVLSAITLEDKAADTANTFGDVPAASDTILTLTLGGIGSNCTFIANGQTWFAFGHLSAITETPATAAFT